MNRRTTTSEGTSTYWKVLVLSSSSVHSTVVLQYCYSCSTNSALLYRSSTCTSIEHTRTVRRYHRTLLVHPATIIECQYKVLDPFSYLAREYTIVVLVLVVVEYILPSLSTRHYSTRLASSEKESTSTRSTIAVRNK